MGSRQLRASILVIGDELLGGFVHDTNSHWLAQRLQEHSVPLDRVQVVPDTFEAIDEALTAELARRRPRIVLTTGGIGSTPDDITFEAVAASLGRPTVEHPAIAARLAQALVWQESTGLVFDAAARTQFLRMAQVPEGSTLVESRAWAPAVRVDVDGGVDEPDGATVVVLPGVPSQMRTLVRTGVEPALLAGRNPAWSVAELTHGYPESVLNPVFLRLAAEQPEVTLGSYPGHPMIVRLKGAPEDVERARATVQAYLDELDGSEAGRALAEAWAQRTASVQES